LAWGLGFLIALVVLLAELRLRRAALSGLLGGAFGAVLGVFAALLVTLVISRTDELSVLNVNQLAWRSSLRCFRASPCGS